MKTFRNQHFLTDDDVRAALREGIQFTRQSKPFDIVAWVLLPNHLHCIWRLPSGDADFFARWSSLNEPLRNVAGSV